MPMWPGLDSQTRRHMWVEFVVGSLLCSERFFPGYSGFPLSSKANISKLQFDLGMHGHFWTSSCELLGVPWVNKLLFFFTFTFYRICWAILTFTSFYMIATIIMGRGVMEIELRSGEGDYSSRNVLVGDLRPKR